MPGDPDVFLQEDRTVVVDEFHATTRRDHDQGADLRFLPNWASLHLGGGGGEYSDGDLLLHERPDEGDGSVRIHLTGGRGGQRGSTRLFFDGHNGSVEIGREGSDFTRDQGSLVVYDSGGEPTVYLRGGAGDPPRGEYSDAGVTLGAGPTVELGGGLSEEEPGVLAHGRLPIGGGEPGGDELPAIYLSGPRELHDGDPSLLLNKGLLTVGYLSVEGEDAELNLGFEAEETGITGRIVLQNEQFRTFTVDGDEATVEVGQGANGDLQVYDSYGTKTVDVTSAISGSGGGGIALSKADGNTTVELRAHSGQVVTGGGGTGGSVTVRDENSDVSGFVRSDGQELVVTVPDGNSEVVAIRVHDDGTVSFPQGQRSP
jgi:hypothetical protein